MRILLLSAYDTLSHLRWREGLVRSLPDMEWTVQTLPPRHFAWRHRGSALSWAFGSREPLTAGHDLIVVTSMTDVASLKGLVPELAAVPTVVYFHENQFAYPERYDRKEGANFQLTNITSALAADRVVFNSAHNRDTFFAGARRFLETMPDCVPAGLVQTMEERSLVLPVPLAEGFPRAKAGVRKGPLVILWNHRWEYDKAPERFFGALYRLADAGLDFRVMVLGQRFRQCPPVFAEAKERLGDRVAAWGFVEDETDYHRAVASCDVAVSTALHDFQGLALLEAVDAGCLPVVPDRLAYREFIPERFRYRSLPDDPEGESILLSDCLANFARDPAAARRLAPPDLSWLSWGEMAGKYRELMAEAGKGRSVITGKCSDPFC